MSAERASIASRQPASDSRAQLGSARQPAPAVDGSGTPALVDLLDRVDPATGARMLARLQDGHGNAATGQIVGAVLARRLADMPPAKKRARPKTGIATDASIAGYGAKAAGVADDWAALKTPAARARKVGAAANASLAKAGVPAVKFVVKGLGTRSGSFDYQTWTMELATKPFAVKKPSEENLAGVAGLVMHEARHAEQWFRMARFLAGLGRTAAEITKRMTIPRRIALAAARAPLRGNGTQIQEARAWYKSTYGADSDERGEVLDTLPGLITRAERRRKAYERIKQDPNATAAQKETARKRAKVAATRADVVYKKYLALPEEADAFRVGGAANRAVLKELGP